MRTESGSGRCRKKQARPKGWVACHPLGKGDYPPLRTKPHATWLPGKSEFLSGGRTYAPPLRTETDVGGGK